MDFSKVKNKLLICLCCFVIILPFYLITFTYASEEENITFSTIDDRALNGTSSQIVSSELFYLYYLEIEKGYTYTIHIDVHGDNRIAYSNSLDVGSTIYNFQIFNSAGEYDLIINSDEFNYIFFDFSAQYASTAPTYTITRTANNVMTSSVASLVDNVGISNLWNIFDISVNYIVVVVLFAFGVYIIFRIIRKISKGKEGL